VRDVLRDERRRRGGSAIIERDKPSTQHGAEQKEVRSREFLRARRRRRRRNW
jgi:hypothetical protein